MMRRAYLWARSRVRHFVVSRPRLDLAVGRTLVRIDAWMRRVGLVSVMEAKAGEFTFRGHRFAFDEHNRELAETILSTGEYEAATLEAILRQLAPGATFVDLGANLGFYTVLAAAQVAPEGRVHAFEPTPATAGLLRRNVEANQLGAQVTIVEAAVAGRPGRARFSLFASAVGNAIAVADDNEAMETIEVEVTSLDAYFEAAGWPRVDVVKMDVEGQELEVFAGMRQTVERNPAVRVVFEYHLGQLSRAGLAGAELIAAARGLGFDQFEALFRTAQRLDLPAELEVLNQLAARANINVMAWRSTPGRAA